MAQQVAQLTALELDEIWLASETRSDRIDLSVEAVTWHYAAGCSVEAVMSEAGRV
jgi:hypothetical protein